jgi:polyphosphate kinase
LTVNEAGAPYFNREQTWLAFNERVLEEAQDESLPLIERARFLAIVSSNLDEFVMVRIAFLHGQSGEAKADPAGLGCREQLDLARARFARQQVDQDRCWQDEVRPALAVEGFRIVSPEDWSADDRQSLATLYRNGIEPTLTPLAVDPTRPVPLVGNRVLHVAVRLRADDDSPDAELKRALVAVPGGQRFLRLSDGEGVRVALLEDVVEAHLDSLFPGHEICGRAQFRATRDGSMEVAEDHDEAQEFLSELEDELHNRGRGRVVRLEVRSGGDAEVLDWLKGVLAVEDADIVSLGGPLDLTCLFAVDGFLDRPDLCYPPLQPRPIAVDWEDPFATMREGELMLHHPFESFDPVVDLVRKAAADPDVLAIKQTLYRVSGNSPIVRALIEAARSGKQVTVLVELKARFDEEANIRWARRLEEAGAHVVYGLQGLKVHAKLLLIIRRDRDGIRRYCHLGTGNYNDKTARIYTDLSYLTCAEAVGRDMAALFNILTGFAAPPEWSRLAVAPTTLRSSFNDWIHDEMANARAGRPARIIAKFNSLVDTAICDELYAASQAGVQVDLIVRGMCILRPGVPGLSENIRVISIVGRFLEHSRIFWFERGGDGLVAIASADWMTRNLDRRVEHLVRIEDRKLKRSLKDLLDRYLEDSTKARLLRADGSYVRIQPEPGMAPVDIQRELTRRVRTEASVGDSDDRLVPLAQARL